MEQGVRGERGGGGWVAVERAGWNEVDGWTQVGGASGADGRAR